MTPNSPTEAETRKLLIDTSLARAGWNVANGQQVGIEIPVDGNDAAAWQTRQQKLRELAEQGVSYDVSLPTGISDYILYHPNGEILAVVEAKRTSIDPRIAQVQTEFYIEQIAKRQDFIPFAFMTNGYDIYFLDHGASNKRLVHGFFTDSDLLSLLHTRQHGIPLTSTLVNRKITDRDYQIEAIRRISEAFEEGRRKALLVMATGTGKTRTVMSLIDIFLRTQQAQTILFVADRDALVKQAMVEGFQAFLPDEPPTRIYTHSIDRTQRLYASTLQTLTNCFERFSTAFFDLIIFDEVHRSIFNRWNEVLQYFDARMIGLTATPADFIDRNTFLQFECTDGIPTFLYSYEDATRDEYLVDYTLYVAKTHFQRSGIRGVDLTEEERNSLIEQGIDPDNIDYSGTELEKTVSNKDTLRNQWQEIMDVCRRDQAGHLPGKTIVFAMTQDHAMRLLEVFEEMFPQFPGLAKVITHTTEYRGMAIDSFKHHDQPRIAISVDMLDTGINVPEVVNLVFMKPVNSRIKLEQMIGRGTRHNDTCTHLDRLPNGHKEDFLVIDFWENDFSREADKYIPQTLPVLVSIFNTRLDLLEHLLTDQLAEEAQNVIASLRHQISLIPVDSFSVRSIYQQVQQAWADDFWRYLSRDKLDFLRTNVSPLLRNVSTGDVQATTFVSKVERLRLQIATGASTARTAQSIAEDVGRLPNFVYESPEVEASARLCLTPDLLAASPAQLDAIIEQLAGQMRNRMERPNNFLLLDLPDYVETRGYIILTSRNEKVYVEDYRRMVEDRILDLVADHPTIMAIERGLPVTDEQLLALERTLRHELGGDLELSEQNIRRAYALTVDSFLAFLRHLFELNGLPDYRDIVERQFDQFLTEHAFTADQILFTRTLKSVLARQHHLARHDLYETPFSHFGQDAFDYLFQPPQQQEILAFTESLAI